MHWVDIIYFERLTRELSELERKLDTLYDECENSDDPDGVGFLDEIESVIGDGFLRCQLYLVERRGEGHGGAYACGPRHRSNSAIEVINAGANYRKHRAEWARDPADARGPQRQTEAILRDAGTLTSDYVLMDLLQVLIPGESLSALLPLLVAWREDFDRAVAPPPEVE
jgi:hypothetical protein